MAKILHTADFHLDSAFTALPEEKARLRRQEARQLTDRLVDYANDHGVADALHGLLRCQHPGLDAEKVLVFAVIDAGVPGGHH